jgi:hypothetical protein
MARLQAWLRISSGCVGVDHLDARAVQHDLLDRAVMQVERAQKAVAVFLLHHALGMAEESAPMISSRTESMFAPASIARRRGAARRARSAHGATTGETPMITTRRAATPGGGFRHW